MGPPGARRSFRAFVYPGKDGWHSAVRISERGRQVSRQATVDTAWLNADPTTWDDAARLAVERAQRMEADWRRLTSWQPAT